MWPKLKCKIFATPFTALLVKEKFKEKNIDITKDLNIVKRDVGRLPGYSSLLPAEVTKTVKAIKDLERSIEEAEAEAAAIAEQEELLQVDADDSNDYELRITQFSEVAKPFSKLWNTIEEKILAFDKWYSTPLVQLDAEAVENDADNLRRDMLKISKIFGQMDDREDIVNLANTVTSECADFIKTYVPLLSLARFVLRPPFSGPTARPMNALCYRLKPRKVVLLLAVGIFFSWPTVNRREVEDSMGRRVHP